MDNEPDLWDTTHRTSTRPAWATTTSCTTSWTTPRRSRPWTRRRRSPARFSGWTGYQYSALDRGDDNFHTHADQDRHGGEWFLPWFLQQVHAHDVEDGPADAGRAGRPLLPAGQRRLTGAQDDQDDPGPAPAGHAHPVGPGLHRRVLDRPARAPDPAPERLDRAGLPRHAAGHHRMELRRGRRT